MSKQNSNTLSKEDIERLKVRKYKKPINGFTHWYPDPKTNDPVPLAASEDGTLGLVVVPDDMIHCCSQVAVGSNQFLFAFFRYEDGVTHLRRVTQDFPVNHFPVSVEMLKESLAKDGGSQKDVGGLPEPADKMPGTKFDPIEELKKRANIIGIEQGPGIKYAD